MKVQHGLFGLAAGAALVLSICLIAASAAPAVRQAPLPGTAADPFGLVAIQLAELSASDGDSNDYFGGSVVLAGNTAFVSAMWHPGGFLTGTGKVYVYERSGPSWDLTDELTATDTAAGDAFGISIAASGTTAVIGAHRADVSGQTDQGSAYVFTRGDAGWVQSAKLVAADGAADDLFGFSVDVDAATIVVGALYGGAADQGAAYVFTRSGSSWTQQARLTAGDGAHEDEFGAPVAVQGDLALVGACQNDVDGNAEQGAAYAFVRSGSSWSEQAKLTAADGDAGDYFAARLALAGSTALIGAPWHSADGTTGRQGAAYVFIRSGSTWTQKAELTATGALPDDRFGDSISLVRGAALIGASTHAVAGADTQGAAYLFVGSGDSWQQKAEITASDGASGDQFARAVSLDGETALIGAPTNDAAGPDWGSAYLFDVGSAPTTKATSATVSQGAKIRLRYIVRDAVPTSGSCVAHLEILKHGTVVKRIPLGVRRMNIQLKYAYRATLKRGTYAWRVRAIDLARHRSTRMTTARLIIR